VREGVSHASEMAIVGDAAAFHAGISRFRDVGVAEFGAALVGSLEEELRTIALLGEVAEAFR